KIEYTISPPERWADWRKQWTNTFPVAAWSYFSRYTGSAAEYKTYKDAGLTMVQAPLNQYKAARSTGLKIISGGWQKTYEDSLKLDYYISFPTADDTATIAYNLVDEPSPVIFDQLGLASDRIYRTDQRKAIPLITMLPNWAVTYDRWKKE